MKTKKGKLILSLEPDGSSDHLGGPATLTVPVDKKAARTILARMHLARRILTSADSTLYKLEFWDWSVEAHEKGKEIRIDAPTMSVDHNTVWWTVTPHHGCQYYSTELVDVKVVKKLAKENTR